ncbi:GrpB family protein, partial [Deinococcus pimensis]|uniref:GrpB family protein n=1 Tax=Deinococcus pimensis TaxID=309888 RepID=UPI001B7F932C
QETRRAHVHLREQGRFNGRYALLCRDYLRAHPLAANAYADVKRQLARHVGGDPEKYYDVKDPVFDIIMAGAFDWAATARWAPPPTDA